VFVKRIFCWKNDNVNGVRQFDFINVLENLLYLCAHNEKIPMYFTKKFDTYDKIKKLAMNNFDYIFDCSGGRLNVKFDNVINWNKYELKKGKYEMKLYDNHYRFCVNGKIYHHFTMALNIYDKNMIQYKVGNMFGMVSNNDDINILIKYNGKCFETSEYVKLSKTFNDDDARYLLPTICEHSKIKLENIFYIKMMYFITSPHHLDRCAYAINDKLIYIGLGDTLGNSEYGIYFGMKSSMELSKHICHLLHLFKNISA
jgi:hypothetical protein